MNKSQLANLDKSELADALASLASQLGVALKFGRDPGDGKPCLFVNDTFTARIAGVSDAESNEILDFLFEHVTNPQFIYRHQWRKGDLLMWDNCATQHRAINDYESLPRRMERTTVMGTASVLDPLAPFETVATWRIAFSECAPWMPGYRDR